MMIELAEEENDEKFLADLKNNFMHWKRNRHIRTSNIA